MKQRISILLALLLAIGITGNSWADVNFGISADESGIKNFYLAIGDYYRQPEKEIVVVRERGIPNEDLPVVFYLASKAGVSPTAIIKLRLGGQSWMDITFHYGLTAEIYYIELQKDYGPPYGKAYGHFKNKPKKQWGKIVLGDADIVNFVNLRFLSSHYGYSPDEIIRMRSAGEDFVKINGKVKAAKEKGQSKKAVSVKSKSAKSKAKKK